MNKTRILMLLISGLFLCSCSSRTDEQDLTAVSRLPASAATTISSSSEEKQYRYLEKITLRNDGATAHPYFFTDGSIRDSEASYTGNGITAQVHLMKPDGETTEERIRETVAEERKKLSDYETNTGGLITGDNYMLTEISYTKSATERTDDKITMYEYPCECIIKLDILADGSYLIAVADIDNEYADDATTELLAEFFDAYHITF